MWLVLMSLRLCRLLLGSWPCRVLLRTRPAVVRLRMAGVARVCVWHLAGRCAVGHAGRGVRLWAPPLTQTGSGWPFSVPRYAARPASAEADA